MTKEERNKVIENNLTWPTRWKKRSLETRNKISKSLKLLWRKHTDEWKLYMSVKMKDSMVWNKNWNKKVIAMKNWEKIKEFDSVKSWAERIWVTPWCVTWVLKWRRKRSWWYERVYW